MNEKYSIQATPERDPRSSETDNSKEASKKRKPRITQTADFIKDLFRDKTEIRSLTERDSHSSFVDTIRSLLGVGEHRQHHSTEKATHTKSQTMVEGDNDPETYDSTADYVTGLPMNTSAVPNVDYDTPPRERSSREKSHSSGETQQNTRSLRDRLRSLWRRTKARVGGDQEQGHDDDAVSNHHPAEHFNEHYRDTAVDTSDASESSEGYGSETIHKGTVNFERKRSPETVVIEEKRPSLLVATAAISAYVRSRSERSQRRKLEKEVATMSELLKEQQQRINAQRAQAEFVGGRYTPPVERPYYRPPEAQQLSAFSHRKEIPTKQTQEPLSPRLPREEVVAQPQLNIIPNQQPPQTSSLEHQLTDINKQTSQQPEHSGQTTAEDVASSELTRSLQQDFAPNPTNNLEHGNRAGSPITEALERRRSQPTNPFSRPVASGAAVQRAREAYQNLRATTQSYAEASREKLLASKSGRLYAEASAFTIWVGIVAGWIIFLVLLIWLARSVFGIL